MTDKNWPEYLRKRVRALDCRVGGDVVVKLFPSECERIAYRIVELERSISQLQQVNLANSELIEQLETIIALNCDPCDATEEDAKVISECYAIFCEREVEE